MEEFLKTFTIPNNTIMEEHSIVVAGGVIIGNHSDLGFGIIADSIIAGERVKINGNVLGKEEVRIDMWSQIGSVISLFKDDALLIHNSCPRVISDLGTMKRKEDRFGNLINEIENKHAWHLPDCLRYIVSWLTYGDDVYELVHATADI